MQNNQAKGRYLGLDYGEKRIGIAISDEKGWLALPLCSLSYTKNFFTEFTHRIKLYTIKACVIGLPLMMSGKDSSMTIKVREFAQVLENELKFLVVLWDERLSSLQADRLLQNIGLNRKKRAAVNDTVAASLILQSYLDSHLN